MLKNDNSIRVFNRNLKCMPWVLGRSRNVMDSAEGIEAEGVDVVILQEIIRKRMKKLIKACLPRYHVLSVPAKGLRRLAGVNAGGLVVAVRKSIVENVEDVNFQMFEKQGMGSCALLGKGILEVRLRLKNVFCNGNDGGISISSAHLRDANGKVDDATLSSQKSEVFEFMRGKARKSERFILGADMNTDMAEKKGKFMENGFIDATAGLEGGSCEENGCRIDAIFTNLAVASHPRWIDYHSIMSEEGADEDFGNRGNRVSDHKGELVDLTIS